MKKRNLALGLLGFTIVSAASAHFFDNRCESGCIGEAFAATVEKNKSISIIMDGDDENAADSAKRVSTPLTETSSGKDFKKIVIKSTRTDWKISEGTDGKVSFKVSGYLPGKEWTFKESGDEITIEFGKKGPDDGELILPKDFSGSFHLSNVSGDIAVDSVAKSSTVDIATVSGDLQLNAAPREKLSVNSVSGDSSFRAKGLNKDLSLDFNSVSGDLSMNLDSTPKKIDVNSVSGEVTLKVSKNVGLDFDMEGMSSDFEGLPEGSDSNSVAHSQAKGSFGSAPKGKLSFHSVSGDFQLQHAE